MNGVLGQIGLVLLVCVGLGVTAIVLRLPLLVGLLVAGVVVGPNVLGLIEATPEVALLGEIGISLLLFVVGLKLDPRLVRELGTIVLATGTAQVVLTAASAFAIALAAGVDTVSALYLAAGMAFSSTVVVIKMLSDRGQVEQLHGRLSLGILIVQDIVVVLLMVVLTAIDPSSTANLGAQLGLIVLRGVLLFAAVALLARYVLPHVVHVLARQAELLTLAAVTWAVALAALAHLLGFSAEVGAFLAGVALASSDYREAISGRLATLRDFLLVFFFIDLGTELRFDGLEDLGLVVALTLFVLLAKPVLIAVVATLLGFEARVAATSGLTMGQISEFSLILAALGVSLEHIDSRIAGVMAVVALVTITVSTLLSARAEDLVPALSAPLRRLQRSRTRREVEQQVRHRPEVVVIGLGRIGRTVFDELHERGVAVLGVDHDPRISRLHDREAPVVFGDLSDPALATQLPLGDVRWIVATPRDVELHRDLLVALQRSGYRGRLAVAVDHPEDERLLRRLGIDLVIRPLEQAATPLIEVLRAHERGEQPSAVTLE
ncbi:MAG: cation:proton antiporter [Nitriliruptoraceae bacterium]